MRLLGLDPGLRRTGWGVIEADGNRLGFIAAGTIVVDAAPPLAERLARLFQGLQAVIEAHRPAAAAVEETFLNSNPESTLKLGHARGVALLAPALAGIPVAAYAARLIKKTVVGTGRADKRQVQAMIGVLLPGSRVVGADAADALAAAICHAHHAETAARWSGQTNLEVRP
jgi:crossover junction endodeoxyribonuclease RuvC